MSRTLNVTPHDDHDWRPTYDPARPPEGANRCAWCALPHLLSLYARRHLDTEGKWPRLSAFRSAATFLLFGPDATPDQHGTACRAELAIRLADARYGLFALGPGEGLRYLCVAAVCPHCYDVPALRRSLREEVARDVA